MRKYAVKVKNLTIIKIGVYILMQFHPYLTKGNAMSGVPYSPVLVRSGYAIKMLDDTMPRPGYIKIDSLCYLELPTGERRYPIPYLRELRNKVSAVTRDAVLEFNSSQYGRCVFSQLQIDWICQIKRRAATCRHAGWLMLDDVASIFGVSIVCIARWRDNNVLPFETHENHSFFDPQQIVALSRWVLPVKKVH